MISDRIHTALFPGLILVAALSLAACEKDPVTGPDGLTDGGADGTDPGTDTGADPAGDTGADAASDPEPDVSEAAAVCTRWNADRADLAEGAWSGSLAGCDPGDVAANGRDNTLKLVNLFRWLCDLPPVIHDGAHGALAQECALMMHANDTLSHTPPTTWTCYTEGGANAAGNSNIATTPSVQAMDMYMQDWGNETTMGHRRWILSAGLESVGVGSTSEYSCLWVLHGLGGGPDWTAWPPPGPFPHEAVTMSWIGLDETGWTLQSNSIALDGATVMVTRDDGTSLPVSVNVLLPNYGSNHAISFVPDGWTSEVGRSYTVDVGGISTPISYTVDIVDCTGY